MHSGMPSSILSVYVIAKVLLTGFYIDIYSLTPVMQMAGRRVNESTVVKESLHTNCCTFH